MAGMYTPPDALNARKRADGQKLTLAGAVLVIGGVIGIVLATILKITWILGFLGGAVGSLAWLAVLIGAGLFVWGFNLIKSAREGRI